MDIYAQIVIKCEYGEFLGEKVKVTEEQYEIIVNSSKEFWCNEPSFYFRIKNGIIIFPTEIARESILIIEQI